MTRRERPAAEPEERRSHERVPARSVPSLLAHLSGGARVTLLDVSLGGARLETTRHMRPGQSVSVRFSVNDRVVAVGARVVRAAVVQLHPGEVRYETGLRLSEDLACDTLQLALIDAQPEDPTDLPSDGTEAADTPDENRVHPRRRGRITRGCQARLVVGGPAQAASRRAEWPLTRAEQLGRGRRPFSRHVCRGFMLRLAVVD